MTEQGLVPIEKGSVGDLKGLATDIGLDVKEEMANQSAGQLAQPYIKVSHDKEEGKHSLYIQLQQGIFDDTSIIRLEKDGERMSEIDFQLLFHANTQSFFEKPTDMMPKCAASNGQVLGFIEKSLNNEKRTCSGCPFLKFGSDCKPGYLLMIGLPYEIDGNKAIYPFLMRIPPTGLTAWKKIMKEATASDVLLQTIPINLKLEDSVGGSVRYGKMIFSLHKRSINEEEKSFAIEAIAQFKEIFKKVAEEDAKTQAADAQAEGNVAF